MTPAARLAAAIEILDLVINAARDAGPAADTIVQRYFSTRRYAGGGDRRAVRGLVYDAIRTLGEVPADGRAAMIGHLRRADPEALELFGSGGHAPAALEPGEPECVAGLAPDWLMQKMTARFGADTQGEVAALLGRAPLDLRVNTLKAQRDDVLGMLEGAEALAASPDALRLPAGSAIEAHPAWLQGLVDVQDLGSQMAAAALAATPGETVLDLCAGAGGKTLALAAAMANEGRLIATDTDRGRLSQMPPRLERAGVSIVETRLLDGQREAEALADLMGLCDRVMVDAPCSGTGTWRRNPEGRWRLTPARLARLVGEQARLLALAATLLKPGGRLTYVVCSLLPEEGGAQAEALVAADPAMRIITPEQVLTPQRQGCDGFSITSLTRIG